MVWDPFLMFTVFIPNFPLLFFLCLPTLFHLEKLKNLGWKTSLGLSVRSHLSERVMHPQLFKEPKQSSSQGSQPCRRELHCCTAAWLGKAHCASC